MRRTRFLVATIAIASTLLVLAACGHTDSHGYIVPPTVTPFPAVGQLHTATAPFSTRV